MFARNRNSARWAHLAPKTTKCGIRNAAHLMPCESRTHSPPPFAIDLPGRGLSFGSPDNSGGPQLDACSHLVDAPTLTRAEVA
ncbi:predicted protein [Streptomyces sp. AA4]|nr:predicted protein [Streptomyces sp. AA4]